VAERSPAKLQLMTKLYNKNSVILRCSLLCENKALISGERK
jgi:hypothetical protein